jgi:hypothetical protein
MTLSAIPPINTNEVLNECQGEGCGCFQGFREAPIKTVRPFTLYERMDTNSKITGRYKAGVMAKPLGKKSLVREKGRYMVEQIINKKSFSLKSGDLVDTFFQMGEGFNKVKTDGKWIEFIEDDIKLNEKVKTIIDGWLELSIGKLHGFTQESPFESCLE